MPEPLIYYVLLAGCLLLALGLSVAVWRRPNTRRRGVRLLAGWLAVAGLWLTAYPPTRTVAVPQQEAILLTEQYQPDTLRTLLQRFGNRTRVWRYAPNASIATPSDTPAVASLATLWEHMPALRRLHVLGQGLPAAALPALDSVRLVQHTMPRVTGFRAAHWNRLLELGQPLLLQGYFVAAQPGKAVWVRLLVAGAPRDSMQLPAGQGTFRLRYVPKAVGRLVATVSAGPSQQTLATEPVPAEVVPTRPLRVLLLAATPSFELKFLKNHLAAHQHAVAWRVGISRGLTQTDFSNQLPTDLSRLTPALLNRYDVVVAEAGVLAALPANETQSLRAAQRIGSLGLVVLTEATALPAAIPGRSAMRLVAQSGPAMSRPQRLNWPDAPTAAALVPATLTLSGTARPLVTLAGAGAAVVASQRVGAGTVVVSALPETYPWLLQNAAATYGSYWSRLLTAAARAVPSSATWLIAEPWPRPHLPVTLRRTSAFPSTPPVLLSSTTRAQLPLWQDTELPEWTTATYWPNATGWHQVQLAGQLPQWFYVFSDHDWQGPETQLRQQAALPWITSDTVTLPALLRLELWPAWWFCALFVLAAGFLWLEEKL